MNELILELEQIAPNDFFGPQNKNIKLINGYFPKLKIIKNELSEFLIFLNSGGVVQETLYIPVNRFFFNLLKYIDCILIFLFPSIFALGRTVILKKE